MYRRWRQHFSRTFTVTSESLSAVPRLRGNAGFCTASAHGSTVPSLGSPKKTTTLELLLVHSCDRSTSALLLTSFNALSVTPNVRNDRTNSSAACGFMPIWVGETPGEDQWPCDLSRARKATTLAPRDRGSLGPIITMACIASCSRIPSAPSESLGLSTNVFLLPLFTQHQPLWDNSHVRVSGPCIPCTTGIRLQSCLRSEKLTMVDRRV